MNFRIAFIFLSFYLFLLNSFSFALTNNPYVKVQGRQLVADFTGQGNYQSYLIQGVDYSPTPIGRFSSDWGYDLTQYNVAQSNPNNLPPNNIFADPDILTRDFSLLKSMNANTIRIYNGDNIYEVGPGTVANTTFENAFPTQAPSYGDGIFSLLQANNIVDVSGNVNANLTSLLPALQPELADPGEYNTVLDVLELALNGSRNPGRFPDFITATTLSTAGTYGLKVIAGFNVDPFGSSSCPTCPYIRNTYNADSNDPQLNAPGGYDLTNPYIANDILVRFEEYVNTFKNDPNILFWAIGNENNLSLDTNPSDPYSQLQINAWYSLVNQMAGAAHQIEGANYHPVAVVNGDSGDTGDLQFIGNTTNGNDDKSLSNVDIWGINIYRGQSFDDFFVLYKSLSSKPLWISEYGADAWQSCDTTNPSTCDPNNPSGGAEDQIDQATWDGSLWDEIAGNGDITTGATVFEYSDEWWKPNDFICTDPPYNSYPSPTPPGYAFPESTWEGTYCHWNHLYFGFGPGSSWGSPSFSASTPDHYFNEEWWGLMGISNPQPETQADSMTPRRAYTALQGQFANNTAALPSYLASPVNNGTQLNSPSTFTWSLGRGVTKYDLLIGTTSGGSDISSNLGMVTTSVPVSRIPTGLFYVQLVSYTNGAFTPNLPNYSYGTNNGTATATINYIYQNTYNTITASAGLGGTISPLGIVSVSSGANQTFIILPSTGYTINQVLVDGAPMLLINNMYAFTDVTSAHTIAASFTQIPPVTLAVAASPSDDGSVTCGNTSLATTCPGSAIEGSSVEFFANPIPDFVLTGWNVTGSTPGADCSGTTGTCTVTITAATSVTANFIPVTETLTVAASPSADGSVTCGNTSTACPGSVNEGNSVEFFANPIPDFVLTGWNVTGSTPGADCSGTTGTCTVTITAATSVTANFIPVTETLTVAASPSADGLVTCGNTSAACPGSVNEGNSVEFFANPIPDFILTGWTVTGSTAGAGCSGTTGTCTVTITAATSVTANFIPVTETLTVAASPSADGSVTCGNTSTACPSSVDEGSSVKFFANPIPDFVLTGWTVTGSTAGAGCSGTTGTCTVTITGATSVTANFIPVTETLTVAASPSADGSVTCGNTSTACPSSVDEGSSVKFFANPIPDFVLTGWTVTGSTAGAGCSGTTGTCTVTITGTTSVTANFIPVTETLTVAASPSADGSVTCGNTSAACPGSVNEGNSVEFFANPIPDFVLTGWNVTGSTPGAGCSGTTGTCTVTITAATSVTANFIPVTETLTVAASPSDDGSVTCGNTSTACPGSVDEGSSVKFFANPISDFILTGWTVTGSTAGAGCSGTTGTCTVTITGATSVTANFIPVTETLTVAASPSADGSVTCGNTSAACPGSVDEGSSVKFFANPIPDFVLTGWTVTGSTAGAGCSGTTGTCTVTITAATSVTANFIPVTETLTVAASPSADGSVTCGNTSAACPGSVNEGNSVEFFADPIPDFVLTGWTVTGSTAGAGCSGTTGTCTVTITGATSVTADFTLVSHIPPTVSIISPANDDSFTTSKKGLTDITIRAKASDSDGAITEVAFYHGVTLLGTVTSRPYIFRWKNVPPGNYILTAVATDNTGAMTTSSPVAVTVTGLPVVSLAANNISPAAPATINLVAIASEANGSISKVEFYNGLTLLDTVSTSPYQFTWSKVAAGKYSLTAVAYDNNNHMTRSERVVVKVNGLPVVGLIVAVDKATKSTAASVNLMATASEVDGTISKVDFYNGQTLLDMDTIRPYKFKWNGAPAGTHNLTAVATDSKNNMTTSKVVVVNVTG